MISLVETSHFDTKLFWYKSFQFKVKWLNCTKIFDQYNNNLCSLCVNKKNIFKGEYSLFFKPSVWNYLPFKQINMYQNDLYWKDFVSEWVTVNQIVPSQLQIIHVVRLFHVIKIHVIMLMCKGHFWYKTSYEEHSFDFFAWRVNYTHK